MIAAPVSTASRIVSGYGVRMGITHHVPTFHAGIDLAGRTGDPVFAVASGTVRVVRPETARGHGGRTDGYGNVVGILHDDGNTWSVYAHQSAVMVHEGQRVQAGQRIGSIGATSNHKFPRMGPHLHFEIRHGASAFPGPYRRFNTDPEPWLRARGVETRSRVRRVTPTISGLGDTPVGDVVNGMVAVGGSSRIATSCSDTPDDAAARYELDSEYAAWVRCPGRTAAQVAEVISALGVGDDTDAQAAVRAAWAQVQDAGTDLDADHEGLPAEPTRDADTFDPLGWGAIVGVTAFAAVAVGSLWTILRNMRSNAHLRARLPAGARADARVVDFGDPRRRLGPGTSGLGNLTRLKNSILEMTDQLAHAPDSNQLTERDFVPSPRMKGSISKSTRHRAQRVRDAVDELVAEGRLERCGVHDNCIRTPRPARRA